jgi:hypothetical protein
MDVGGCCPVHGQYEYATILLALDAILGKEALHLFHLMSSPRGEVTLTARLLLDRMAK